MTENTETLEVDLEVNAHDAATLALGIIGSFQATNTPTGQGLYTLAVAVAATFKQFEAERLQAATPEAAFNAMAELFVSMVASFYDDEEGSTDE